MKPSQSLLKPNQDAATLLVRRVLIESSDGVATWTTVGVSYNIIEASLEALADAVTYKLYKTEQARWRAEC